MASQQKQWSLKSVVGAVLGFLKAQFLPLAFLVAVLVAMLAPEPGKAVAEVKAGPFHLVQMINIIIVFLISGLTLNTKDMGKAVKHWKGMVWGFVSILGVTPTLGFALKAIPFTPSEFAAGLAIFSAAPTTLGVGAALVRQSKGNDALALILLTGTNLLAVFTLPLWLKALFSGDSSNEFTLSFSLGEMIWQLLVTVLAPAVIGKLLRDFVAPVGRFATKYKDYLSMFSVANLAFIVWQTLSAAQSLLVQQQFVNILYIIIAAVIQHIIYLVFNALVVRFVFKMPIEEGIAVTIMAGQKSAPVAVTAITYITDVLSTQGLLSVPCIVGQLVQIFMGAAYAPVVAKRVVKVKAARKQAEEAAAVGEAATAVEEGSGSADAIEKISSSADVEKVSEKGDSTAGDGIDNVDENRSQGTSPPLEIVTKTT